MPCGGKCMYQNRYNQFACVCPEPFYLDADGISCILEKEVPEYEPEDVLMGLDTLLTSTTTTTTTEQAKEIDQTKEEQMSSSTTENIRSELDLIIFPGTLLPVENSSSEASTTASTTTTAATTTTPTTITTTTTTTTVPTTTSTTTTTTVPTTTVSTTSTLNPLDNDDVISTASKTEDNSATGILNPQTIQTEFEFHTESTDSEIMDQNVDSMSNSEISKEDINEEEFTEMTTAASIQLNEESNELRGIKESATIEEEKYVVDNTADDTTENVASVSSFESVSSTSLPVTANAEDKVEDLTKDDMIEDVVSVSAPDSTLSTEFVTKESAPEDLIVDLLNSSLLEQDNDVVTENNDFNEEIPEKDTIDAITESVEITLESHQAKNDASDAIATSTISIAPSSTISSTTSQSLSGEHSSTTKAKEIASDLAFEIDGSQEIESIETTDLPLTIKEGEENDIYPQTEQILGSQTAFPETLIPTSTENIDDPKSIGQPADTTTFIVDILKNAEESDDGTITAGIAVELSSEAVPTTIANSIEVTSDANNRDKNDDKSNLQLGETENLIIPVTENDVPETTTPGLTNLLIPIDDSATVNITIPLIDESANADELEKKLREILNTVSEELDLEENGDATETPNSETTQIKEEESVGNANAILEELTTPKEEVMEETHAGTPRKLDFGSALINQLFETKNTKAGV